MIAFFSSDPYFKRIYEALEAANFKVDFLATEEPKGAGRGRTISENPAHQFAKEIGIPIVFSDAEIIKAAQNFKTKLGFTFGYGKIIKDPVIKIFPKGVLNFHPSLLPKYRGAAPIQSAVLNGEKMTGYSIIEIDKGVDSGSVLAQKELEIKPDDNYDSLKERLVERFCLDLPDILTRFFEGRIAPKAQDEKDAIYTDKIKKQDGLIDSSDSAETADRKIRAYSNWPKAYFEIEGKKIIIHQAILVGGMLEIQKIQLENKNIVSFNDFKNGYPSLLTRFPRFVRI